MLTKRSTQRELIDLGPDHYSPAEYATCLNNLFTINRLLGFFRSTLRVMKRCSNLGSVLDIGCGGGLFLLHLSQRYPSLRMQGIDVSDSAIAQAKQHLAQWRRPNRVEFSIQEAEALSLPEDSVDLILSTLVCHHIADQDLPIFLRTIHRAARTAVILNDLHRHVLAYGLYKLLCPLVFRNRLIRQDGLVSIQRGFTRQELETLLRQAGIARYELRWGFPFRWQVVLWKK